MAILGLLIIIYGLTFSYTGTLVLSPMMLPLLTGVALFLFGVLEWRKGEKVQLPSPKELQSPLVVLVLLLGYIALLKWIGFILATVIFGGILVLYFGGEKKQALCTGVSLSFGLYLFFQVILQVSLP